jgi:hypothetical protein
MQAYKNLSGASGVVAWEAGADYIKIRFRGGDTYLYNREQPGARHLARLKALAAAGRGISTYISRYVRDNYAAKL